MTIYTDNNRALVDAVFERIGAQPLNRTGAQHDPVLVNAENAGLIAWRQISSADPYDSWAWQISAFDLLILAGPEWCTEARREAHRLVDHMATAVMRGHGQATDAEREAAINDNRISTNAD